MHRANRKRLEAIYRTVKQTPGIRPGTIARRLGMHRYAVTRALPALEREGLLLSEDPGGRLWPWDHRE